MGRIRGAHAGRLGPSSAEAREPDRPDLKHRERSKERRPSGTSDIERTTVVDARETMLRTNSPGVASDSRPRSPDRSSEVLVGDGLALAVVMSPVSSACNASVRATAP
jgi:hypothetical protein